MAPVSINCLSRKKGDYYYFSTTERQLSYSEIRKAIYRYFSLGQSLTISLSKQRGNILYKEGDDLPGELKKIQAIIHAASRYIMLIQYNTGHQCTIYALNSMKYFAVLFFCFLTERLVATKSQTNDSVSRNVQLIDAFGKGIQMVPLPTIECGDRSIEGFAETFRQILLRYTGIGLGLLSDEALQASSEMIDAVQKDVHKLERSIESTSKNESNCLEHDLKVLTKQLQEFLDLNPGNVLFNPTTLPRPVQQVPVKSRTTKRPLSDLVMHLCKVLDEDLSSFYGFIEELFITGRANGRPQTGIAAMQLRNETLNGPIMDANRRAAEIILENSATIKPHVEPKIWKSSKNISEHIIKISNDFNAS